MNGINGIQMAGSGIQPGKQANSSGNSSFGDALGNAVNQLNQQQTHMDQLNNEYVKGQITDVAQLMEASTKASLGLALAVQVRDKVITAYQDIMRMQI